MNAVINTVKPRPKLDIVTVQMFTDVVMELRKMREEFPDIKQIHWLKRVLLKAIEEERESRKVMEDAT